MKRLVSGRGVVLAVALVAAVMVSSPDVRAHDGGPLGAILSALNAIRAEITDPGHGLAALEQKLAPAGPFRLSSGLFGLPQEAQSVDWMVVNNSTTTQTIRVTVYRHGIGIPRAAVVPGTLTLTLGPTETTHNANSVGAGLPFRVGFYYEVVVETDDLNVLPSVHVWPSHFNNPIPGTLIPPGSWVRLQ